jgi:hypothetical protein
MINSLGLSFGLLIALFIPGFILLSSIVITVYRLDFFPESNIKEIIPLLKDSYIFVIFIITTTSLTLGLFLDGTRYLITYIIQWIAGSKIDTSIFKEEDRKYFDWVIEHNFRFHQFYSNIFLGLLISVLILNRILYFSFLWPVYVCGIICLISAFFSYKKSLDSINDRINLIRKEEKT